MAYVYESGSEFEKKSERALHERGATLVPGTREMKGSVLGRPPYSPSHSFCSDRRKLIGFGTVLMFCRDTIIKTRQCKRFQNHRTIFEIVKLRYLSILYQDEFRSHLICFV